MVFDFLARYVVFYTALRVAAWVLGVDREEAGNRADFAATFLIAIVYLGYDFTKPWIGAIRVMGVVSTLWWIMVYNPPRRVGA